MGIVRNNHYAALSSKPTEWRISLHETRACVSELSRFAMSLAAGVFMAGSKKRSSLNVAAIGNGRVAALLDDGGRLIWWCFRDWTETRSSAGFLQAMRRRVSATLY